MVNLEKLLKEELLKEAEEIRAEVKSDEALQAFSVTPEMDRAMEERIRKEKERKKALEALSEEERELLRRHRDEKLLAESDAVDIGEEDEKVLPFKVRKKSKKAFVLVAIVAVFLLAMGTTSIGGKPFILDFLSDSLGEREVTKFSSVQENEVEHGISDEEKFLQQVEETFGTKVVKILYTPFSTKFLTGEIDEELGIATLFFECENHIIQYQVCINYQENVYGYDAEDEVLSEEKVLISNVPITVKTMELPEGELQYEAQFEYKNIFYILNAVVSEEEFEKILSNLIFY